MFFFKYKYAHCGHFKPKNKSLAPSDAEIAYAPICAYVQKWAWPFNYLRMFATDAKVLPSLKMLLIVYIIDIRGENLCTSKCILNLG